MTAKWLEAFLQTGPTTSTQYTSTLNKVGKNNG